MKIDIHGEFTLQVFENGKLVETIHEKNLIVNSGRDVLLSRLTMDATAEPNFEIDRVAFGTGQVAAHQTDTIDTFTNLFTKTVTSKNLTFNQSTAVASFEFTLATGDYNGNNIYEFGLVCADTNDTLFSRRVRTQPIVKTNALSFTGTWKIIASFN